MTATVPGRSAEGPEVCITCRDHAVMARVVALLGDGMARVEAEGRVEVVSVEVVEAAPSDVVLVHAGVAIANVGPAKAVEERRTECPNRDRAGSSG